MTTKVKTSVRTMFVTAALTALLVPAGFAQKQSSKTADDGSHAAKTGASKAATSGEVHGRSEVFSNVTIGPGQSAVLDSGLDYTYVELVRVSVRSANADLSSLQFVAYWSVPGAEFYNATQAIEWSTFIYGNTGGAQFSVYGSQFRLVLKNTGSSTVNLLQVLLFPSGSSFPPCDSCA